MQTQPTPLLPTARGVTRTLTNGHFLGGLAAGAAIALVLSNEGVQRAIFRGIARIAAGARAGVEEVKERFHDAEAEVRMEPGEEEGDVI